MENQRRLINSHLAKSSRFLIRVLAGLLLVLAMVIATVNYGLSNMLSPATQNLWRHLYFYYEYFFRAFTVFLGSFLTYRLLKARGKTLGPYGRGTLFGFSISAFFLLVVLPLAIGYWEIYYVLMPFPWTTLPLQIAATGGFFGHGLPSWRGVDASALMLWTYGMYQLITLVGTLILGRRWHCGMLCMLNGCHAESLGIALPVVSYNKKRPDSKAIPPALRKILIQTRNILFFVNLALMAFWTYILLGGTSLVPQAMLNRIELIKYIALELTLLMVLWFFVGGRGYCYYCPAGFGLALIARLVGQRIETNLTRCTQCGACNRACKMSIDIMAKAADGLPVTDLSCVGCGLCVDSCPTQNLQYRTGLYHRLNT